MTSKIVTLHGVEIPDGNAPDPVVVAGLEELLQMAKEGMIVGFTAIAERRDGIYRVYEEGPFNIEPLVGHMHRQIYRLVKLSEELDPGED